MSPSATSITTRIKTNCISCITYFTVEPKCDIHYNKD